MPYKPPQQEQVLSNGAPSIRLRIGRRLQWQAIAPAGSRRGRGASAEVCPPGTAAPRPPHPPQLLPGAAALPAAAAYPASPAHCRAVTAPPETPSWGASTCNPPRLHSLSALVKGQIQDGAGKDSKTYNILGFKNICKDGGR